MQWVEKNFGRIWVDQMASDCYGPHPVRAYQHYLNKIDKDPHFQFELFRSVDIDHYDMENMRMWKETYYHFFPYNYAVEYVKAYESSL